MSAWNAIWDRMNIDDVGDNTSPDNGNESILRVHTIQSIFDFPLVDITDDAVSSVRPIPESIKFSGAR